MDVSHEVTELRLQLFDNGYSPIPNRDKRTFTKGWSKLEITEDLIRKWGRRNKRDTATGLRLDNGLAVIDIDVNIPEVFDAVSKAIEEACPVAYEACLIRRGKGVKQAWFVRTAEPFSRIFTHRWRVKGAGGDADTHCVEIFGGAANRQFGAFGPHTIDDNGTVLIEYQWDGDSPADVPIAELPKLTKAQFFAIADAAERALEASGLEKVTRSSSGESDVHRVYDLVPEMEFDCDDMVRRSLDDLRGHLAGVDHVRCSASWLEGPEAKRLDRCIVSLDRSGGVCVWESSSGVTHCELARKPVDYAAEMDRAREKLKELEASERNRLSPRDSVIVTAAKLEALYAYQPEVPQKAVVPIWTNSLDAGMTMASFRTLMLPHGENGIGPRGGQLFFNPADMWAKSKKRVTVAGLRMRPDQPRPLYQENGQTWINTYDPPAHVANGGDASIGFEFFEHLLPDERERMWFLQWLAHKVRYPAMPGPAVVMVAQQQGTGRGTLAQLVRRIFGSQYVATLPFHIFAGKSYQSQYNEWAAEALVAIINESSEQGPGAYASKHSTYEHLKETVEPRMETKLIVRKGLPSFHTLTFTSYIIATNNADALPIPPEDRRFAVLSNGGRNDEAFWDRINAWMNEPANVAAFVEALRALDPGNYSPTAMPPRTDAKDTMIDLGRSDLDHAFDTVMENLAGEVFVPEQVVNLMRDAMRLYSYEFPHGWQSIARRMVKRTCHRVGVPGGANWNPQIEGKRYSAYAKTKAVARRWREADGLREEILKNGKPSEGSVANIVPGLFKPA